MGDIEKRMHELREIGKRFAKAKAQRDYLDHFRKSKLAILTSENMQGGNISHAAAESKARADAEYLQVLTALKEATEESEAMYWELRVSMEGIGIWRTQQASARSEREGYGA